MDMRQLALVRLHSVGLSDRGYAALNKKGLQTIGDLARETEHSVIAKQVETRDVETGIARYVLRLVAEGQLREVAQVPLSAMEISVRGDNALHEKGLETFADLAQPGVLDTLGNVYVLRDVRAAVTFHVLSLIRTAE